jgi:hypothetical protein
MPKTYDLAAIIKAEKDGGPAFVLTLGKKEFPIPPASLWPDDVFRIPDVDAAAIILGDRYEEYCEAGGTAALLFRVNKMHNGGASLPESEASTDS